jgi:hypothetical protein
MSGVPTFTVYISFFTWWYIVASRVGDVSSGLVGTFADRQEGAYLCSDALEREAVCSVPNKIEAII